MGIKEKPEDLRTPGVRLYNLDDEIGEVTNVAEQHPGVAARLQKLAEEMIARRLARLHGGDVTLLKSGDGARFLVRLCTSGEPNEAVP